MRVFPVPGGPWMMTYRRVFNNPATSSRVVIGIKCSKPCRLYRACIALELLKWCVAAFLEHEYRAWPSPRRGCPLDRPWVVNCVQHSAVPLERALIHLPSILNRRRHVDIHARWVLFRPGYLLAAAKLLIQPSANSLNFSRMAGASKDRFIGCKSLCPNSPWPQDTAHRSPERSRSSCHHKRPQSAFDG